MYVNGISSGSKSADAAIKASAGKLYGVTLISALADCTLVLYDDPDSAAGTALASLAIDVSLEGGPSSKHITFPNGIAFTTGCYGDVTGAGATYIVYYE